MMGHAAMKRMSTKRDGVGESADHREVRPGARGRSRRRAAGPSKPPRYYAGRGRVENTAHPHTCRFAIPQNLRTCDQVARKKS
jgi:hypothetical protein